MGKEEREDIIADLKRTRKIIMADLERLHQAEPTGLEFYNTYKTCAEALKLLGEAELALTPRKTNPPRA